MLRLSLDPAELARTRFAMSPMVELFGVLSTVIRSSRGTKRYGVHRLLDDKQMPLLAGFLQGDTWLPDFINPTPTQFAPTLDDELHQIATLAPDRLVQEITVFTTGITGQGFPGTELSASIRGQLERGETAFAEKAAQELHALWHRTLAPRWPAIRSRLEAEINARSQLMARLGTGAVLNSLHPDISWHDTTLTIRSPFRATVPHAPTVIMIPTVTASHLTPGLDPLFHHETVLCYPIPRTPAARHTTPDNHPAADVLGATRHALLLTLNQPLTTAELAERHRLDPSTVSYHLTRLHRAGLLTRTRHGHRVYYRRTPHAERLLHPGQEQ
ncbi:helix-turn-helix domain-containing protein [Streptomyces sp. NBC_00820]|uniref:ArsR/SmtB family transcription factor n=1 Tax=Streptomyces sp. NBC_00820 TaxID=2975842 RepID=UPI002ED0C7E3|nr:helix-turn-helix domain-containing protein [Streptomyces sp. NBC_00820]